MLIESPNTVTLHANFPTTVGEMHAPPAKL